MILIDAFKRTARGIRAYRYALAAFLLPFTVRAIPEIIAGPYPIGWDIIAFYIPNTLDMAAGKLGVWGVLGSAPLMYAITVPIYVLTGISPILLYKALGPILFGALCWAVLRFCKNRLNFGIKNAFLVVIFLSFYFVTLRLAWDAYQTELGLTLFLLGLTIPNGSDGSVKSSFLRSSLFFLSILANQIVGVLVAGSLILELFRSKSRSYLQVYEKIGPIAVFCLIVYATLQPSSGPGILTVGQQVAPFNIVYNSIFLIYALGPLLPLAFIGATNNHRFSYWSWISICALGIALSAFPGQMFQDIGYRWVLLLSIPVIITAARGYQILVAGRTGTRIRLRMVRVGIPLLLVLSAGLYSTSEAASVPYFSGFLGYVPSSMVQSSVPLSDSPNVVAAMQWLDKSLPSASVVITHEAFYGWARLYLAPNNAIINSLLNSPSAELVATNNYRHVFTIWWVPGSGWFSPTFPTGATISATFGDIAVYEYR